METSHRHLKSCCLWLLFNLVTIFACLDSFAAAETHYHEFVVQNTPVKRLCRTHNILTVNGEFPGPTVEARNGDSLVIKVVNSAQYNISIHWHGLRMLRNPWADGPSYVTQCPIMPGGSYTYRFTITNQEGTFWWHAHTGFLRATVYGAFIIYPKLGSPYPFSMPKREFTILLGEWFDRDPVSLLRLAQFTGAAPNVSVAFTMNGQPGDLYRCSSQDTVRAPIEAGETILLRLINSALNQQLFFSIANHRMTVVGTDAAYTKPLTTRILVIGPGQTINVLVTGDQPPGRYYMAAHAYESAMNAPFDNTTTTAILEYKSASCCNKGPFSTPILPVLPAFNDTATATAFTTRIRGLSKINVFTEVDVSLYATVGLGLINCTNPNSPRCQGPNGTRFTASMNNVSFVLPTISLMQAYYEGIPGVFTTDFPPVPPLHSLKSEPKMYKCLFIIDEIYQYLADQMHLKPFSHLLLQWCNCPHSQGAES